MKVCVKCKEEKEFICFPKRKDSKDGLRGECKVCKNKVGYNYKKSNIEKVNEQNRLYRIKNIEVFKQNYIKNKSEVSRKSKLYYIKNAEDIKSKKKLYQKNHLKEIGIHRKKRRDNDPLYKLKGNIRSLINLSIKNKGYTKKSKTYEYLGCSYEEFKNHLERQFSKSMTWQNAGEWHLDHIYPVSLAKDEDELIKLNHYTNFQPLWAIDNLKKGNKIIEKQLILI